MMPLGAYRRVLWVVIYLFALERDRSTLGASDDRRGLRYTCMLWDVLETL